MRRPLLFLLGALVGLCACDLGDLDDTFSRVRILIQFDPSATAVGVNLVDAATGELVEGATVTFDREQARTLIVDAFDLLGENAVQPVEGGVLVFGLANRVVPTAGRPVEVPILLSAPGYLPQRRIVHLVDTGFVGLNVEMVSAQRPPRGVATQQASVAVGAGGTEREVTLTIDLGDGARSAVVRVPQGTALRGPDGGALTGTASLRAVAFYPERQQAALVPEGTAEAREVTLGIVTVEATVGGVGVVRAEQPFEVTLGLPGAARNPATGEPLAVGDEVIGARFDPSQGAWTDLERYRVGAGKRASTVVDGQFRIAGVYRFFVVAQDDLRGVEVGVERQGNTSPLQAAVRGDGFLASQPIATSRSRAAFGIPPQADRGEAGVYHRGRFVAAADAATCTDCRVTLPDAFPTVTLRLRPVCADPDERVYTTDVPLFGLSARRRGGPWFPLGRVTEIALDESADDPAPAEAVVLRTTDLEPGATYDVAGRYPNGTYTDAFRIDGTTVERTLAVPGSLCQ